MRCLFLCFEAVSGLNINLSKSDIVPIGEVDDVEGARGERPLKILFPELYNIACNKDAWVEENMEIPNDFIHWNVMFIHPMHD